jgi:hypothetical protein
MTQMLDVLFLEKTGHVLTVATRAGGDDPAVGALAGDGLIYPLPRAAATTVLDVPIPEDVVLDRASVELTDGAADALFARDGFSVKDGALVNGLAALSLAVATGRVTVTLAPPSKDTPYVVVVVPDGAGAAVFRDGVIPAASSSYQIALPVTGGPHAVVVFVKGFVPKAA